MNPEKVTLSNISEYTSYLIYEFYNNNLQPFFDALDENVVWIGTMDGQFMHSKQEVVNNFLAEDLILKFTVGPIYAEVFPHGKNQCDVVVFFNRTAFYDDGRMLSQNMSYHLSWVKKETWLMSVISIMIRYNKDNRDGIYPRHPLVFGNDLEYNYLPRPADSEKLKLHEKGTENTLLIGRSEIEWAEGHGHYCKVHFRNAEIWIRQDIKSLAELTRGSLMQCHSGYIINPYCIRSIQRFKLTLIDGTEIPIPEKKYTEFREQLFEFLSKKKTAE